LLRELLAKQPKYAPALMMNARLSFAAGRRDQAIGDANSVLAADANTGLAVQAHMLMGRIHAEADRLTEAESEFQKALQAQPRSVEANVAMAELYLTKGNTKQAAAHARDAVAAQPSNPQARGMLVRTLVKGGDLDGAKKELQPLQTATAFKNSVRVVDLQALIALAEKRVDDAHALYDSVLRAYPEDTEAFAA